jgi:hypothetical protein
VRRSGPLRIVDLGCARVVVVTPDHLEDVLPGHAAPTLPFLAGFSVAADLSVTAAWLRRQSVDFEIYGGRLLIGAGDASGTGILFESPDAQR